MKALDYLILLITEIKPWKCSKELKIDRYNILHCSMLLRSHKCQAKLITHWLT